MSLWHVDAMVSIFYYFAGEIYEVFIQPYDLGGEHGSVIAALTFNIRYLFTIFNINKS